MMQAGHVAPARVAEAIQSLEAREELRSLYHPDDDGVPWWLRALWNLFDGGESSGTVSDGPVAAGQLMEAMPYLIGGLVLFGVLLVIVVFFLRASKARREGEAESEERRASLVREQLEQARAARAAGDLGAALRGFWAALVTGLGRGDELVYRPAWTCREMLVRSRSDGPDAELLGGLLPRVERLEFGRAEIRARDVDELAELCAERLP